MIYAIIIYESIFCLQIVYAIGENTAIKTSYAFLGGWKVCVERDTGKKWVCERWRETESVRLDGVGTETKKHEINNQNDFAYQSKPKIIARNLSSFFFFQNMDIDVSWSNRHIQLFHQSYITKHSSKQIRWFNRSDCFSRKIQYIWFDPAKFVL